ncbi:transcription antitermination factor NusB [Lacinutrix salivirga]
MLSRRHIRIKVMQILYAFKGSESDDFSKDQKFLMYSIDTMYDLYLTLISLIIEVQKKAEDHLEKSTKKHLATKEEKNPNRKFVENEVLQMLKNNQALKDALEQRKINNWQLDSEYVDVMYRAILENPDYKAYMSTQASTFKEDRNIIATLFKDVIAPNEKLYEYLEDKNLTWLDDLPTINTTILKLLNKIKQTTPEKHFTPVLYKDADDKDFAIKLFQKTLLNQSALNTEIEQKAKNWDTERIANIDFVLLLMALCEIKNFPSIPTKVTINEYLEIAKEYSTPKSNVFINGILDRLVKEYEAEGKLNKIGRGLM